MMRVDHITQAVTCTVAQKPPRTVLANLLNGRTSTDSISTDYGGIFKSRATLGEWVAYRDFIVDALMLRDHKMSETSMLALLIIDLILATYCSLSFVLTGNFGTGIWGPWALAACPHLTVELFWLFGLVRLQWTYRAAMIY